MGVVRLFFMFGVNFALRSADISRKFAGYREKSQDIKKSKNISRNFKFYREKLSYIKK